jgi:hypothetical protein
MDGKEKCRILKGIREKIAQANEIEFDCAECTHEGPCKGTCPRCEQEAAQLEKALEKRMAQGKRVALVGLCAGIALTSAGCSAVEELWDRAITGLEEREPVTELAGDVVFTDDLVGMVPDVDPLAGEAVFIDDLEFGEDSYI